jgi:hypothetical protein
MLLLIGRCGVKIENKIEIARNILNNAAEMNMSKSILLKISQKIDKYIVKYYHKNGGQKGDMG